MSELHSGTTRRPGGAFRPDFGRNRRREPGSGVPDGEARDRDSRGNDLRHLGETLPGKTARGRGPRREPGTDGARAADNGPREDERQIAALRTFGHGGPESPDRPAQIPGRRHDDRGRRPVAVEPGFASGHRSDDPGHGSCRRGKYSRTGPQDEIRLRTDRDRRDRKGAAYPARPPDAGGCGPSATAANRSTSNYPRC